MAPGQKTRQLCNLAFAQGQCSQRSVGTSSATSVRNVRGINKGKGLDRLIKKLGGKPIKLNISAEQRPVGENNEFLSREIGIITRYHAPIQRLGWQNMTKVDKEALHTLLKLKFDLDFNQEDIKGCVELLFSSSYKSFHHRCYEHYVKHGGGENARMNPHKALEDRLVDWLWLCDHFETEEFQKRSAIGKDNRSNLPYMHRKGTKSFVALQHELNKMVRMQEESMQQDEIPLTEPQICEKVLGKAYGYIRGRGHGPKPNRRVASTSTRTYQQMEEELASTKQVVAVQQNQLAEQQNQLESQQKQLDWLHNVVSKLAGMPSSSMNDNDASRPSYTATTSNDGSGSLLSDGISGRSCI